MCVRWGGDTRVRDNAGHGGAALAAEQGLQGQGEQVGDHCGRCGAENPRI